uniref:Cytochrome b n=1 Tax=Cladotaenia vulturi TaxID=1917734 RepID=A0A1J0I2V0_9CEST|nr:cytochrome b [Cladotaenia vulturi]APC62892.1 cytochrome b [Cladotaenia vulturi]
MISIIRHNLIDLPIGYSINYYWCSGSLLSFIMFIQVLSGVILSFLYIADSNISFSIVMNLSNDSFLTWCLRYWHMLGVNILFILLFIHMGRSLYYSSYNITNVWNVGFIIYLLVMGEAFTGYILPWHQMSYWAATVITSIIDSIPVFGGVVFKYVVGGFSVSGDTLIRIFSVHVCLGFVILGLMVLHVYYLHQSGSNNPLVSGFLFSDLIYFHSYHSVKDLFVLVSVIGFILGWLFYCPDMLVDIEAYLEADSLNTPVSIKPEWYFLMFYSILRCIASKIGGIVLIFCILFLLWLPVGSYTQVYSVLRQILFWSIVSLFFILTYLGSCHPEYPYLIICQICSILMVVLIFIFKLHLSFNYNYWL